MGIKLNLSHVSDDMIHMSGFGWKDAGVMELDVVSQADVLVPQMTYSDVLAGHASGAPTTWWGYSVDTRLKKKIQLEHSYKSAVVEHSISLGHSIEPHNTSILSTKPRHMDHIIREVAEIDLHSNNMNREDEFCLS
jgi:hypothetical protein